MSDDDGARFAVFIGIIWGIIIISIILTFILKVQ